MTKQELVENYTKEQLAEIVLRREEIIKNSDERINEAHSVVRFLKSEVSENEQLKRQLNKKNKEIKQFTNFLKKMYGTEYNRIIKDIRNAPV